LPRFKRYKRCPEGKQCDTGTEYGRGKDPLVYYVCKPSKDRACPQDGKCKCFVLGSVEKRKDDGTFELLANERVWLPYIVRGEGAGETEGRLSTKEANEKLEMDFEKEEHWYVRCECLVVDKDGKPVLEES